MTTATLGDLLDRRVDRDEDENERAALRASGTPERRYDATRLRIDARKTGNFLRQLGVGPGRTVAIADVPTPESVLTLFGAALLGASARFVPFDAFEEKPVDNRRIDARVLVGPAEPIHDIPVNATKRVAYGDPPEDPEIAYFERDVWSENPTFPPGGPSEREIAIEMGSRKHTHRELVRAAEQVVDEWGLDWDIEIAVRAPLTDPRTIVAGVFAPLSYGGVTLLPDAEARGDLAVVDSATTGDEVREVPEPETIDVENVALDGG